LNNPQRSNTESSKAQAPREPFVGPLIESHVLILYIAGLTPRSTLAVERIRTICDRHLAGRYQLTVIDLFLQPELARLAQIVVAPTLVKQAPSPRRLFVGDMADEKKILLGLNIVA
jgi:circadian clock protein KaiB